MDYRIFVLKADNANRLQLSINISVNIKSLVGLNVVHSWATAC